MSMSGIKVKRLKKLIWKYDKQPKNDETFLVYIRKMFWGLQKVMSGFNPDGLLVSPGLNLYFTKQWDLIENIGKIYSVYI